MSQYSLKLLKLLKLFMVVLCLSLLSACGSKDDEKGKNEIPECKIDGDCLDHERCNSSDKCEIRTTCSEPQHCAEGQACINGTCDKAECSEDNKCKRGYDCQHGICEELDRQCTAVGQTCTEDRLARDGFACVDLGDGLKCQVGCKGAAGSGSYSCPGGSICIDRTYCEQSECEGPIAGQATCDAVAAADKTNKYPNGASCVIKRDIYGNSGFTCKPSGNVEVGDACDSAKMCKSGLLCIPGIPVVNSLSRGTSQSYCAEPCDATKSCSVDGESCIGASAHEFAGAGICGERCDPFKAGEELCSDDKSCIPVSKDDGICTLTSDNEAEMYSECTEDSETSECPSGTWCFGVTKGESRCLPLCNPALATQEAADATCPLPQSMSFGRIAHLAKDVAGLDVYLGAVKLADGLEFGALADDNGKFLQLKTGTANLTLRLAGEEDVIYTKSVTLTGNEMLNFAIVDDAESTEDVKIKILSVDEPREVPVIDEEATVETTELRVVHAISDLHEEALDIVVVRADEDADEEENRQVLGTAVVYGTASSFKTIESNPAEGSTDDVLYDVYFVKTGETTYTDKIAGLKVTTGQIATVYLAGTAADAKMKLIGHAEADKVRLLGGHCYDLTGGQSPKAGLGLCFEKCTDVSQLGSGVCSGGGTNACNPVSPEQMWCFPSGQSELGGECKETADCQDGLICDENGAGTGTCREYCEHRPGSTLTCSGVGEICAPIRGFPNLGECRLDCDGGSGFEDNTCPESQKSCFGAGKVSYCQGSGPNKLNEECEDPTVQNCAPGSVCAKRVPTFSGLLTESFTPLQDGEVAHCRALCTPFLAPEGKSECGDGYACSPLLPGGTHSVNVGHCVESGPTLGTGTKCGGDASGKMCGDNAYCVEGECVRVCDLEALKGCPSNESCRGWDGGSSLLFGILGRCM